VLPKMNFDNFFFNTGHFKVGVKSFCHGINYEVNTSHSVIPLLRGILGKFMRHLCMNVIEDDDRMSCTHIPQCFGSKSYGYRFLD
jgi:hypothetical protein